MTRRKVYHGSRGNNRNSGRNKNHSGENRENREGRDNRENKDNREQRGDNRPRNFRNNAPAQSMLPSPVVLQEYEYAKEGSAGRIIEMAEIEQDRRNAWEDEYLRFYKKSQRIGQLCGFVLLLSVILAVIHLSDNGNIEVAQVLAVSAFGSVAVATIFSGRKKNRYPRKPRQPHQRQNQNNEEK
jgi:uncharacterized membrane protein